MGYAISKRTLSSVFVLTHHNAQTSACTQPFGHLLSILATLINTKLWEHQTEAKIIGDTDKDNVLKWCTVFW